MYGGDLYPSGADATVVDGAVESAKFDRIRRMERQGYGDLYAAVEYWLNRNARHRFILAISPMARARLACRSKRMTLTRRPAVTAALRLSYTQNNMLKTVKTTIQAIFKNRPPCIIFAFIPIDLFTSHFKGSLKFRPEHEVKNRNSDWQ